MQSCSAFVLFFVDGEQVFVCVKWGRGHERERNVVLCHEMNRHEQLLFVMK